MGASPLLFLVIPDNNQSYQILVFYYRIGHLRKKKSQFKLFFSVSGLKNGQSGKNCRKHPCLALKYHCCTYFAFSAFLTLFTAISAKYLLTDTQSVPYVSREINKITRFYGEYYGSG